MFINLKIKTLHSTLSLVIDMPVEILVSLKIRGNLADYATRIKNAHRY